MLFQGVAVPILDQLNRFSPATDIGAFVSNIIGLLLIVASLAAFIYLVLGGLEWIMAGGDKAKVEDARNRITNAIIGLAIIAASWAIFLLLNHFFGLGLIGGKTSTHSSSSSPATSSSTGVWKWHCAPGGSRNDPPSADCITNCRNEEGLDCQIVQTDQGPGCWCKQ